MLNMIVLSLHLIPTVFLKDLNTVFSFKDEVADVKKKLEAFAQCSDDDVISDVIGRPLVNILEEAGNVDLAVENFLSNSELIDSFSQVCAS